ncbi:MAG: MFS transporter [Candidatus Nanoarchaeia archaeon]
MQRRHHRIRFRFTKEMLKLPTPIKVVSITAFIYTLGWAIIDPFFLIYLKKLFGDYTSVGVITALLYIFAIVWSMPLGQLLNRVSGKFVILLTLVMYFPLGYLLLALRTFTQFTILKLYNSFTAASLWISLEDYVREHSDKRKAYEAFGMFDTFCSLSYVIGPIIGALLLMKFGFNMFYVVSITSFLAFLISLTLKDGKKESILRGIKNVIKKDKIVRRGLSDFLRNKKLIKLEVMMSIYMFGISAMALLLPLFLKEHNATYLQIGIIFSLYYLPLVSESYFSTLTRKKALIRAALAASITLLVLMFFTSSIMKLFILILSFSFCTAAIMSVLRGKLTNYMPRKEIGEMSGIEHTTKYVAIGLGLVMSGIIADAFGLRYIFLMVAAALMGLLLLSLKKGFKF